MKFITNHDPFVPESQALPLGDATGWGREGGAHTSPFFSFSAFSSFLSILSLSVSPYFCKPTIAVEAGMEGQGRTKGGNEEVGRRMRRKRRYNIGRSMKSSGEGIRSME